MLLKDLVTKVLAEDIKLNMNLYQLIQLGDKVLYEYGKTFQISIFRHWPRWRWIRTLSKKIEKESVWIQRQTKPKTSYLRVIPRIRGEWGRWGNLYSARWESWSLRQTIPSGVTQERYKGKYLCKIDSP